jgi:hypothetical protein
MEENQVKEQTAEKRYCGNCSSHNTYDYPDVVFCMRRFLRGEKAVTPTLSVCDEWRTHVQKCFCVDEALKKQTEKK